MGNMRERDYWRNTGIERRIIFRWTFRKWDVWVCNGLSWLRIWTGSGHL
jgi:hypothetical protein